MYNFISLGSIFTGLNFIQSVLLLLVIANIVLLACFAVLTFFTLTLGPIIGSIDVYLRRRG